MTSVPPCNEIQRFARRIGVEGPLRSPPSRGCRSVREAARAAGRYCTASRSRGRRRGACPGTRPWRRPPSGRPRGAFRARGGCDRRRIRASFPTAPSSPLRLSTRASTLRGASCRYRRPAGRERRRIRRPSAPASSGSLLRPKRPSARDRYRETGNPRGKAPRCAASPAPPCRRAPRAWRPNRYRRPRMRRRSPRYCTPRAP